MTTRRSCNFSRCCPATPHTQRLQPITRMKFRLFPLRSPLLRESRLISLPRGTKMFQFPRFASRTYVFSTGCRSIISGGFPHSGILGSTPACGSPRLFAARYALLRLLAPRHPPYALISLTAAVAGGYWLATPDHFCSFLSFTCAFLRCAFVKELEPFPCYRGMVPQN